MGVQEKAFPQPVATVGDEYHAGDELVEGAGGMSLRDWFAGQALAGISLILDADGVRGLSDGAINGRVLVGAAYALADRMMIQRGER